VRSVTLPATPDRVGDGYPFGDRVSFADGTVPLVGVGQIVVTGLGTMTEFTLYAENATETSVTLSIKGGAHRQDSRELVCLPGGASVVRLAAASYFQPDGTVVIESGGGFTGGLSVIGHHD